MIRIVFFFILAALAVSAAVLLADYPGTVRVEWLGRIIELPIGLGIAATLLVALAGAIIFWLFRAIWRTPHAIGQGLRNRRSHKGYQALSSGMVAVAAGDAAEAKQHARKANVLLEDQPLTRLLAAQAAQLDGDEQAAEKYFTAMLDDPQTEFLGIRGMLTLAAKEGDRPTALKLSKRAVALKPNSPWAQVTGFEAEVNSHLWMDAQITLSRAVTSGTIGKADGAKLKAALLVERSRVALSEGRDDEALKLAAEACKLNPASRAAALWLATRQLAAGKQRAARSAIEKAWAVIPSEQLAEIYVRTGPADEKPAKLLARLQRLAATNPDHAESLLALSEAQMTAGKVDEAREGLLRVEAVEPTRRVYRLLADLERQSGNPMLAEGWLNKADHAIEGRGEISFDPASAPERVWSAAPGWRGRDMDRSNDAPLEPARQGFIAHEGKVPQLPPPEAHSAGGAGIGGAGTARGSTESLAKPPEPPPAQAAKPKGSAANGAKPRRPETIIEAAVEPPAVAIEMPAAAPPKAPPVAKPAAAPVAAAALKGTSPPVPPAGPPPTDRNWLSRPTRSIGGSAPGRPRKSWLSRPPRSI